MKPPPPRTAGDATADHAGLIVTSLGAGLVVGAVATVAGALVVLTTGERVSILLIFTLLGGLSRGLWVLVQRRRHGTPEPDSHSPIPATGENHV